LTVERQADGIASNGRCYAVFWSDFAAESPDRELACAPIHSEVGDRYLGATRAAAAAIVDGTLKAAMNKRAEKW